MISGFGIVGYGVFKMFFVRVAISGAKKMQKIAQGQYPQQPQYRQQSQQYPPQPQAPVYCPYCKNPIAPGSISCPYCGARFR